MQLLSDLTVSSPRKAVTYSALTLGSAQNGRMALVLSERYVLFQCC